MLTVNKNHVQSMELERPSKLIATRCSYRKLSWVVLPGGLYTTGAVCSVTGHRFAQDNTVRYAELLAVNKMPALGTPFPEPDLR